MITGFVIVVLVGNPCAALLKFLEGWLGDMTGSAAILVGAITGAMIAFDLGGPLNKVAYSTGAALVGTTVALEIIVHLWDLSVLQFVFLQLEQVLHH